MNQHITNGRPGKGLVSAQKVQHASVSTDTEQMGTPARTSQNVILALPAEIRNMIYEYILACPPTHRSITRQISEAAAESDREPPFLRAASDQIRREAAPIYYSKNTMKMEIAFGAGVSAKSPEKLAVALHDIIAICGNKPFTSIDLTVRASSDITLEEIRPLLDLIRETGIALLAPGKRIKGSSRLAAVVGEAFKLGERAHSKGWSPRVLAIQFSKWNNKKIQETKEQEARRRERLRIELRGLRDRPLCRAYGGSNNEKSPAEFKERRPRSWKPAYESSKDPAELRSTYR